MTALFPVLPKTALSWEFLRFQPRPAALGSRLMETGIFDSAPLRPLQHQKSIKASAPQVGMCRLEELFSLFMRINFCMGLEVEAYGNPRQPGGVLPYIVEFRDFGGGVAQEVGYLAGCFHLDKLRPMKRQLDYDLNRCMVCLILDPVKQIKKFEIFYIFRSCKTIVDMIKNMLTVFP